MLFARKCSSLSKINIFILFDETKNNLMTNLNSIAYINQKNLNLRFVTQILKEYKRIGNVL